VGRAPRRQYSALAGVWWSSHPERCGLWARGIGPAAGGVADGPNTSVHARPVPTASQARGAPGPTRCQARSGGMALGQAAGGLAVPQGASGRRPGRVAGGGTAWPPWGGASGRPRTGTHTLPALPMSQAGGGWGSLPCQVRPVLWSGGHAAGAPGRAVPPGRHGKTPVRGRGAAGRAACARRVVWPGGGGGGRAGGVQASHPRRRRGGPARRAGGGAAWSGGVAWDAAGGAGCPGATRCQSCAQQAATSDVQKRPLRSRFWPRLSRSVMPSPHHRSH
jgi:hypothetical protein